MLPKRPISPFPTRSEPRPGQENTAVIIVIYTVAGALAGGGMPVADLLPLLGGAGLTAVAVVRLSTARARRPRRAHIGTHRCSTRF
ncbi:hypothetical protein RND61_30010 [Streptomyces sp. TRM76323]|uniref:Uncharacterized protein n=1 Tax=Streptomyces tamarix TaxID=3078565 RepID=A0ABU3QVA3_9ACTN|nr:hypothetical protein [Streptomyces tamarix]MDT9686272.1 hypothetical protein [Streptomyces tamarix]